jgi:hypothetical protein
MEFTRAGVTVQQGCEESSATWQDGTHEQSDGCTTGVSGPVAVECSSDPYVKASIDGVEVDQAPDAPACQ